jgi:predicted nuclease with TOPRIM domain|tara:strand:- start:2271 stop:2459 length:189 start_codon:yes stop_codon:yes gene_type:complete
LDYEIKSWYELYEQNDKLEGMIIIYQQEIEKLELEKSELKEEILFLKQQLEIQTTDEDINKN